MFGDNDNNQDTQNQTVHEDNVTAAPASVVAPEPVANNPLGDFTPTGTGVTSASSPVTNDVPDEPVAAVETPATTPTATIVEPANDDLLTIKQQALQQLTPLVGHLDQSPEEKFRTTMMMIQAADDQTLLKSAFEAAKLISDDKARAQALLDIINEINYFTQQQSDKKDAAV